MSHESIDLEGAKVLIVDDTPANLNILRHVLEPEGYSIMAATSGEQALGIAGKAIPDLILLDVMMPGIDGFETSRQLQQNDATRNIDVIFVTAKAEIEGIVEGFQAGGVDYIVKPFQEQEVLVRVRTHLERALLSRALAERNAELEEEIARRKQLTNEKQLLVEQVSMISQREAERWGIAAFVGRSTVMNKVLTDIARLQQSSTTSVLITGESGTGKELIARGIHFGSARSSEPFVPVNCSAIPSELAESMLFGHLKGSFTGADTDRKGYFELADRGTLFLDEIGDMPMDLQTKLLRVLEDGVVMPVGATEGRTVAVRVVAATNANMQEVIAAGRFRRDLYFRLAAFPVSLPPLRERQEDIPPLAEHFIVTLATEMGMDPPALGPEARAVLQEYSFPGNVRELKNIIERALIESMGADIGPAHIHFLDDQGAASVEESAPVASPSSSSDAVMVELPMKLVEAEKLLIERAMEQTDGNISAAARLLGTNRPHIYRVIGR